LSEATDGAGAGADVVFAAILGTGAGAGIAVHGKVLQGPNGLAGEWGHNSLPFSLGPAMGPAMGPAIGPALGTVSGPASGQPPNPPAGPRGAKMFREADDPIYDCYCGQRGCIETLISGPGIARDHLLMCRERLSDEQIAARAAAGDLNCKATMDRHARRLARALASVINLLDPDVIVLGGGLSLLPHLYTEVPRLWGEWVFSGGLKDGVRTRLEPSKHGDASGARGAAWLWWRG
jgi:predicted NBD/HSP70 family sugar kinase